MVRLPLTAAALMIGILWLLSSCKDNTLSGGGLIPPSSDVVIDTIPLKTLSDTTISVYSGDLATFSAGRYHDQLFGDVGAEALLQPALVSTSALDTFTDDSKVFLRLFVSSIYGDSTSSESFNLVEASRPWRALEWKADSAAPASNTVVASFTVGMQDSLDVPLSQAWITKYRQAYSNADSTYAYTMPGFVIVPLSTGKIVAFDASKTEMIIQNDQDTAAVAMRGWANSLSRTNVPAVPATQQRLYSTFEHVPRFDIKLNTDRSLSINGINLGTRAISRVVMVFYSDSAAMKKSLPANHVRPEVQEADLYYLHDTNIEFEVLNGPISGGIAEKQADGSFRIDLTSRINSILAGSDNTGHYYLVPQARLPDSGNLTSGTIFSLVLNTPADPVRYPRLIITSVKPRNQ